MAEFLTLQLAVHDCGCPASKVLAYYESRLSMMRREVEALRARVVELEACAPPSQLPSLFGQKSPSLFESLASLFEDIIVLGMMFPFQMTNVIHNE